MEYEGPNHSQLRDDLREWHKQHPFDNGIDWQSQYMWAIMEDEQAFAFLLKHPQYITRFTNG
jgi:hypothetical protein